MMSESICRICLKNHKKLINLFNKTNSLKVPLYDKLIACVPSLNISEHDPYPNHICKQCCQSLGKSYNFHRLCIQSDEKLRTSVRELEIKIEMEEERDETNVKLNQPVDNQLITECNLKSTGTRKYRRKKADCYDANGRYIRNKAKPKYECDFCGKHLFGKYGMEQHLRIHTDERPFTCELCGKRFRTRGETVRHLGTHNSNRERKFKCSLCPYQATEKHYINKHKVVHMSEYQYECPVCSKQFRTTTDVQVHRKRIHANPTVLCKFCNEKFHTNGGLRRHILRHYRTDQYQCNGCSKAYARHTGLVYHMKLHHPDMKLPTKQAAHVVNT